MGRYEILAFLPSGQRPINDDWRNLRWRRLRKRPPLKEVLAPLPELAELLRAAMDNLNDEQKRKYPTLLREIIYSGRAEDYFHSTADFYCITASLKDRAKAYLRLKAPRKDEAPKRNETIEEMIKGHPIMSVAWKERMAEKMSRMAENLKDASAGTHP
jgi:hypothetical protein